MYSCTELRLLRNLHFLPEWPGMEAMLVIVHIRMSLYIEKKQSTNASP